MFVEVYPIIADGSGEEVEAVEAVEKEEEEEEEEEA